MKYQPETKEQLKALCDDLKVNLGDIDTSKISDMSELFWESKRTNDQFAGIQNWDVSNVTNMASMFRLAKNFNQNIENWNVSKVKDMSYMFCAASEFNQPLAKWNISNVEDNSSMFKSAGKFNQNLNKWDISLNCMFDSIFEDSPIEEKNYPDYLKIIIDNLNDPQNNSYYVLNKDTKNVTVCSDLNLLNKPEKILDKTIKLCLYNKIIYERYMESDLTNVVKTCKTIEESESDFIVYLQEKNPALIIRKEPAEITEYLNDEIAMLESKLDNAASENDIKSLNKEIHELNSLKNSIHDCLDNSFHM